MNKEKTIERDDYLRVVALSEEAVREFFGVGPKAEVIDDGPVNSRFFLAGEHFYRVKATAQPRP